jgi:hypothetical protein
MRVGKTWSLFRLKPAAVATPSASDLSFKIVCQDDRWPLTNVAETPLSPLEYSRVLVCPRESVIDDRRPKGVIQSRGDNPRHLVLGGKWR